MEEVSFVDMSRGRKELKKYSAIGSREPLYMTFRTQDRLQQGQNNPIAITEVLPQHSDRPRRPGVLETRRDSCQ